MGETVLRQWAMLQLLPAAPRKVTANELLQRLAAQGFTPTKRTVERDLQTLSTHFPLLADARSVPFGWCWAPHAEILSIPAMTPQAALVLRLARDYLGQVLPGSTVAALDPYFRRADRVLAEAPQSIAAWPDKVRLASRGQPLIPPEVDTEVLTTVYEALQRGRRLSITYRRRREPRERDYEASPLGIVLRDGVITVVATLYDYPNTVQLHVHRMLAAAVTDKPANVPEGFDLDDWLARDPLGYQLGDTLALRIRMTAEAAKHLAETPLSAYQVIGPVESGWREITATVADTAQLRWWLLGLGAEVAVVEPRALREDIAKRLREALAYYELADGRQQRRESSGG